MEKDNKQKTAIIIGAGPAGLTAAAELLKRTDIKPVVLEMSGDIGGISKTVDYKGNRIDIGGHRFFSKSKRVLDWWEELLPLQGSPSIDDILLERDLKFSEKPGAPDPEKIDRVMLLRRRISRIYFLGKFFDYPISLSMNLLTNLGLFRLVKIFFSYVRIRLRPVKKEKTLEDFFINRFGRELYRMFFENYTEKLWGIPCKEINPEWGAQRVKGVSITKVISHAVNSFLAKNSQREGRKIETSLIGQFNYPKFGPGQLWEEAARRIVAAGGEIRLHQQVVKINTDGGQIVSAEVKNEEGKIYAISGDYFFSTMPVKDLVATMDNVQSEVADIAVDLKYRDFITVGLLLRKLALRNTSKIRTINDIIPDNWVYTQDREVRACRFQIFNNWSPYLVRDRDMIWIGAEYVCAEGDDLWSRDEKSMTALAIQDLCRIGVIKETDVLDSTVIKIQKAYPAYFGAYNRFDEVKKFLGQFDNLFLVGRNGMHRYNNMDHSVLSAMTAVDNIVSGRSDKENIWLVNTEDEYHE